MNRIFLLAIVIGLFTACQSDSVPPSISLEEEVMAIHDEVMPQMGHLSVLLDSLQHLVVGMQADTLAIDTALVSSMQTAANQLTIADEAMMDWMRHYKKPGEDMTEEQKMAYLEAEKVKVNEVKDKMLKSISEAEELLQQLQPK